ncbi:MAG: hypothetical protein K6G04_06595, partial [Lachnospiraceae bacterium]|nr:hypothetical protein [Lachnospiraceae bacterium]
MANQNHITKQIGKRALALALAIATAVGSWSLDWNTLRVEAYASTFDSDGTNYTSGGTITEYYTNETTGYQKLTGVSFCVGTLKDGNAIYTVNVYDGDMKAEIGTAQGGNITAVGQVNVTGIDATIAPGDSVNVVITFTQVTASSLATKKDGTDGSEVMLTLEDTTAPATSVTISSCTSALAMGQSGQIVAVDETYGRAITYTSSDTSIVTVDSEGVITPVSSGTASITAKTSVDGDTSASATVSVVDVAFSNTNLTFTGAAQLPTVTATVGSTTLTKSSDYSVSGSGTDVGTYTATVTGSGSYAGVSASSDFTIAQADMADATVDSASCTIDTTTSSVTAVSGVKLGSYALTYGTDFTASATRTSGSLVGSNYVYTYTVTLTGTGNMTGTKTITGVTATADAGITLSDVYSIEVPEEADLYVGNTEEEIKKAVVVKDANGNKVTDPGFAYTISAIDKAGTVTVKATYANYYAGEISTTFTLYCNISNNNKVAATLSGATTSDGKWVYTGNAIEPGVTVTYDSSTTLIEGTDYTITYSNNTDAGNGSVVITGKGNYTGSITKTFTIVPNITNATIKIGGNSVVAKSANNFVSGYSTTYTGSAITPSLVVNLNGSKLTQGTNYTATWSNNTNAGDATVTITTSGDSYGVQSVSATFTITPASITGGTLSLETTSYTYSGNAYKPEDVTLTVGGTALAATDYTLEYSNNTNAGTAFVTATGTGNYTDSISTSFTIHPKTMTASNTTVTFADMSYTGSALEPMPTSVVVDSVTLEEGTDYSETLTYSNNKNIGTATGTITGTGNYTGSVSGTFQIKARAILGSQITYIVSGSEEVAYTDLTVTGSGSSALGNYISSYSAVYNGYERKPAIKVMDGDSALVRNRDYTLTYANNTDAGTATVTIAGKGNYAGTGSVVISYTVSKCDLNNSRITINSDTMTPGDNTTVEVTDSDRTSSTSRPSGLLELYDSSSNADGDYTITWNDDTTTAGADKTMTLTGQNNYTGERVVTYNQGVDISEGSMTIYDRITDGLVSGSVNGYSVSKVTYMGETSCGEIGPAIKVGAKVNATDASTSILTKGTHYTVRYDAVSGNGYDAGSIVKVTATGAGATHYGTLVGYYYIIPAPLDTTNYKLRFSGDGADASVNGSGQFTKNYAYSSSVITPNFTLTYAPLDKTNSNAVLKETVLTSGTDYTYTPPTMSGDIGDKTGTFTGGGSNFDSTTEVEVLYTIGAADVADATIADIS